MYKKIAIIVCCLVVFLICGCSNNKINQKDDIERFYLEDKYYNNGRFIEINSNEYKKIKNESYIIFTYNNYCNMAKPCEEVFKEFANKYKISILSINFEEFRKTLLYDKVKYAPSVVIVNKGKILAYLDANEDNDLDKYQDINEFEKWLNNYIYFSK